ncbi:MAG: hypothetical protein HOE90_17905 [Bacteriovoracaceae bacterium]|jgi:hypothetical protein|nr:hypothetical protein [Bacteriovoracaceae bacterium]
MGGDKCVAGLGRRAKKKRAGCLPGFVVKKNKGKRDDCYEKSFTYYNIPVMSGK